MAKSKDNTGLIIAVVGVGAVAAYLIWQNSQKNAQQTPFSDQYTQYANATSGVLGAGSGLLSSISNLFNLGKKTSSTSTGPTMSTNW